MKRRQALTALNLFRSVRAAARMSCHKEDSACAACPAARPTDEPRYNLTVTFDIETIVDEEPQDGSFPPWPRHCPVAAAFLTADWRGEPKFTFDTLVYRPGDEEEFYEQVGGLLPEGVTSITYNGRGFDLRVLQLGAMAAHRFDLSGLRTHAQPIATHARTAILPIECELPKVAPWLRFVRSRGDVAGGAAPDEF